MRERGRKGQRSCPFLTNCAWAIEDTFSRVGDDRLAAHMGTEDAGQTANLLGAGRCVTHLAYSPIARLGKDMVGSIREQYKRKALA